MQANKLDFICCYQFLNHHYFSTTMKILLFLIFLFCVPTLIYCSFENRVINSVETPPEKYPFIAKLILTSNLRYKNQGIIQDTVTGTCSSTIISKRHILTAAHCVVSLNDPYDKRIPSTYYVKSFYVDFRPEKVHDLDFSKYGITPKVYIHRGYNDFQVNDIAILEFPNDVNFEQLNPVILAKDYVDNFSDMAVAVGYGRYIFDPVSETVLIDPPPTLRHAYVKIRRMIDCLNVTELSGINEPQNLLYKYLKAVLSDEKSKICAGNSDKLPQRLDRGDSGGPLLYELNGNVYQLGVASTISSLNVRYPGKYTRISYYCGWIEKVTNGEVKCQSIKK